MLKSTNYTQCDLRKKSTVNDFMIYNKIRLSFKDCMVILVVLTVLLLSVAAVYAAPNPSLLFGI